MLAYARALLTSAPEGATAYVPSDIRDTEKVLAGTAETLDLSRPVAAMAPMVLQYIPDGDDPWGIVGHVLESLPPGSYLTVSDTVRDIDTRRVPEGPRGSYCVDIWTVLAWSPGRFAHGYLAVSSIAAFQGVR
jgi:hypothetical protein